MKKTSIEREIFPLIASDGNLFCTDLDGYWKDVGQPQDYIEGMKLFLNGLEADSPLLTPEGSNVQGRVIVVRF